MIGDWQFLFTRFLKHLFVYHLLKQSKPRLATFRELKHVGPEKKHVVVDISIKFGFKSCYIPEFLAVFIVTHLKVVSVLNVHDELDVVAFVVALYIVAVTV